MYLVVRRTPHLQFLILVITQIILAQILRLAVGPKPGRMAYIIILNIGKLVHRPQSLDSVSYWHTRWHLWVGPAEETNRKAPDEVWYHLTITHENKTEIVYINGVFLQQVTLDEEMTGANPHADLL